MAANYNKTIFVSQKCKLCGGQCLVPGNAKATQENAHQFFEEHKDKFNGVSSIPNECVPFANGDSKCPHELGII